MCQTMILVTHCVVPSSQTKLIIIIFFKDWNKGHLTRGILASYFRKCFKNFANVGLLRTVYVLGSYDKF